MARSEHDEEAVAMVHEIARLFGKAISASCANAAGWKGKNKARDDAWVALADKIIEFAYQED